MQKLLAVLLVIATSLVTSSSQYQVFWRSADLGVHVVDGVFGNSNRPKMLEHIVKQFSEKNWAFTVDGRGSNEGANECKMGFKTKSIGKMGKTKAVKKLQGLAKDLYGNTSSNAVMGVEGRIIERGDFDPVIIGCFNNLSTTRVILVLTKKWKKNDYGEISIYDKNEEVVKSFHPKYGRTVFLPCGVHFKISPPSINVEMRHYILLTELGNQKSQEHVSVENKSSGESTLSLFLKQNLDFEAYQDPKIIPDNFIKRKFYASEGRRIFVYDDAVPLTLVDATRTFITEHADYYESPVHEADSADNVKWILSLDEPEFQDNPLWLILKQMVIHTAGKEFYPYDISCNHIRRTDSTTVHKDIYDEQGEYTVLLYLNPNFTESDYGETSFLEKNEIVAAIKPKYGRVVVFDGLIDHSAHPSSPKFPGARYTLAVKTAPTIKKAMIRYLQNDGVEYYKIEKKLKELEAGGNASQKQIAKNFFKKLHGGKMDSIDVEKLKKTLSIKD